MLKLQSLLQKQPNDPFLLYGIAMEHRKAGDSPDALVFYDRTIAADPNYCYAYFQKGQLLESLGDVEAARQTYQQGIEAAQRSGDSHARSEIEGALEMLA